MSWSSPLLLNSLYQPVWFRSLVYSLHPDKTVQQYCHYCLSSISFSFWSIFLLMSSNSSFVIHSFFLIILAWSHKHCSVIFVPYRSFQTLCIRLLYPLIGLPSSSTGLLRKLHSMTAVFSVFFHVCLSLLLKLIPISLHLAIHMKIH